MPILTPLLNVSGNVLSNFPGIGILSSDRINRDIYYLLRDIFNDNRSAGAVNGTLINPGTRTVTDTNSKLSIAGGVLDFATGGAGTGNPGLWYDAQTRRG